MTTKKNIGIWMGHSVAHLMDLDKDTITTTIIESEFTHEIKEESLHRSENLMHNKEQTQQHGYFKKIGEAIRNYNEIFLFGPTTAKSELLNLLKADHHFKDAKIEVKSADKMTEHQQHAFVKEHFQQHI